MFVCLIGNKYCDQLRDPGEKQIGMLCFPIPRFTSRNTRAVLEMETFIEKACILLNSRISLPGSGCL